MEKFDSFTLRLCTSFSNQVSLESQHCRQYLYFIKSPVVGSQSSNHIDTELSLRVEDGDVETEQLLLLRSNLLLGPLGQAEDIGQTEALLGDG